MSKFYYIDYIEYSDVTEYVKRGNKLVKKTIKNGKRDVKTIVSCEFNFVRNVNHLLENGHEIINVRFEVI